MKVRSSAFLLPVVLCLACGTTVSVKMLQPAEVHIGPVRNLAVLDFEFVGSWNFVEEEEPPKDLTDVAVDVIRKALEIEEARPPEPDPHAAYPGSEVAAKLTSALVANGHFSVVERGKLSKVMREHALSLSGAVDPGRAAKLGRLLGVDALILGTGNYTVKDVGEWFQDTVRDKEGAVVSITNKYRLARKVNTEITYRVVDVATGQVVASRTNGYRNHSGNIAGTRSGAVVVGANLHDAYQRLADWKGIVSRLVGKVAARTVNQVAPHHVWRRIKVRGGRSGGMKAGKKYAERGMWDEARDSWESVLSDNSDKAAKDHVAATYNLGVYYEVVGNLDKAEENYDRCFKRSGKDKYLNAKARVRRRRKEVEELQRQMNDRQGNAAE